MPRYNLHHDDEWVHERQASARLELEPVGGRIVRVSGLRYHPDSAGDEFSVGRMVRLEAEPDPYDRNAVAVRSADGRLQAGWVDQGDASWLSVRMQQDQDYAGVVMSEFPRPG